MEQPLSAEGGVQVDLRGAGEGPHFDEERLAGQAVMHGPPCGHESAGKPSEEGIKESENPEKAFKSKEPGHAHKAGDDWLLEKFGRKSNEMKLLWKTVPPAEMDELAVVMMNAASAKGDLSNDIKIAIINNLRQVSLKSCNIIKCGLLI